MCWFIIERGRFILSKGYTTITFHAFL